MKEAYSFLFFFFFFNRVNKEERRVLMSVDSFPSAMSPLHVIQFLLSHVRDFSSDGLSACDDDTTTGCCMQNRQTLFLSS